MPFSRANIYAQGRAPLPVLRVRELPVAELTFDHVVPVSQGGRKDWENIVTACIPCNRRKGGRTPAAGRNAASSGSPVAPARSPVVRITFGLRDAPASWRDYLYWNVELDRT